MSIFITEETDVKGKRKIIGIRLDVLEKRNRLGKIRTISKIITDSNFFGNKVYITNGKISIFKKPDGVFIGELEKIPYPDFEDFQKFFKKKTGNKIGPYDDGAMQTFLIYQNKVFKKNHIQSLYDNKATILNMVKKLHGEATEEDVVSMIWQKEKFEKESYSLDIDWLSILESQADL